MDDDLEENEKERNNTSDPSGTDLSPPDTTNLLKQEPEAEIPLELDEEQGIGKDELNLVEYPLSLIAKRIPKRKRPDGTYEEVKTIQYEDWTTIDGQRRPQRFIVTGSDAHGLPTGPDNDVFLVLIEAARQRGFKDNNIPLRNAYKLLKSVSHTGGTDYERFMRAIPRWTGLTVHSENALWDRKGRRYIARFGFNLFSEYKLVERERTTPGPHGRRDPIFYGYVTLSPYLQRTLQEGNLKDLDLAFYKQLPNPLSRRLYRFLDKKRWFGGYYSMDANKLCLKLGFDPDALAKYRPAKIRNLLTPALEELKSKNFLADYRFQKTQKGQKVSAYFTIPGTQGLRGNPFNLSDEQLSYAQVIAEDIAEILGMTEKNRGFYFKTAAEAVRDGKEFLVRRALSDVKSQDLPLGTVKNRSKLFHHIYEELKQQIDLPFDSNPRDTGSAETQVGDQGLPESPPKPPDQPKPYPEQGQPRP